MGAFARAATVLLAMLSIVGCAGEPLQIDPAPPLSKPLRILVDSIHAHNNLAPLPPADSYGYHRYMTYERGFAYLKSRGVEVNEIKSGRITADALRGQSMLFINLVTPELPPFRRGEVDAIRAFVEAGGGLLLITDHSNCYYHNHKLIPLLDELGIETHNETACDRGESAMGGNPGWVSITRFTEHPLTRGLRRIVYQTGGTVDERGAVARLSPAGWGDLWQWHPYMEGDEPGLYGDWAQQPGERSGELGVLYAKELGKGRIVIVPDQNCFANFFLNYADNYRLFLNAFAWCGNEPLLAEAAVYERWRTPRILAYEHPARPVFGLKGPAGLYHVFDYLTREHSIFATDDLSGDAHAIVLARGGQALPERPLKAVLDHLRRGRLVVILNPDPAGRGVVPQVTRELRAGEPQADADTLSIQWPGAGRIVQIIDRQGISNQTIPSHATAPDAAEKRRMAVLARILK